jgi:CheY-like chemotaxis protein
VGDRILVVEDEKIIQLDLRCQLEQLGYVVAGVASTGDEAIAKAAQLEPDLVLMDVRLKGAMDGIEAAKRIQAARQVPVIYLTAQDHIHAPEQPDLKLRPCLHKPFRTGDLQTAVALALK